MKCKTFVKCSRPNEINMGNLPPFKTFLKVNQSHKWSCKFKQILFKTFVNIKSVYEKINAHENISIYLIKIKQHLHDPLKIKTALPINFLIFFKSGNLMLEVHNFVVTFNFPNNFFYCNKPT